MAGASVARSVRNWATASLSAEHRIAVTTTQNFSNFGVQTLLPPTLGFTSLAAVAITPPCSQPHSVVNLTNVRSTTQAAFSGGGTHRWVQRTYASRSPYCGDRSRHPGNPLCWLATESLSQLVFDGESSDTGSLSCGRSMIGWQTSQGARPHHSLTRIRHQCHGLLEPGKTSPHDRKRAVVIVISEKTCLPSPHGINVTRLHPLLIDRFYIQIGIGDKVGSILPVVGVKDFRYGMCRTATD